MLDHGFRFRYLDPYGHLLCVGHPEVKVVGFLVRAVVNPVATAVQHLEGEVTQNRVSTDEQTVCPVPKESELQFCLVSGNEDSGIVVVVLNVVFQLREATLLGEGPALGARISRGEHHHQGECSEGEFLDRSHGT